MLRVEMVIIFLGIRESIEQKYNRNKQYNYVICTLVYLLIYSRISNEKYNIFQM